MIDTAPTPARSSSDIVDEMTRDESKVVMRAYLEKFGDLPTMPPLDLGHASLNRGQYAAHLQAAIDSGKPINWYEIFPPLPEGCLS